MIRTPIALCLISAAALASAQASAAQQGSELLYPRSSDSDWIHDLHKDMEPPLMPSFSLKIPSVSSTLSAFPSTVINPGKKSSTSKRIIEVTDDKGTRRATTTIDNIGRTRTTVIEEDPEKGYDDLLNEADDFTRPTERPNDFTSVVKTQTVNNTASFSGNTGLIIDSGNTLRKRDPPPKPDPAQKHRPPPKQPRNFFGRTTKNTKTEHKVDNNSNLSGNRGEMNNVGNSYGQYNECSVIVTARGFSDGLAEAKEQIEKRDGHHHHHLRATGPDNPSASKHAQVPAASYGGSCVCNCGQRKRSLSEDHQPERDAVALHPFVEPTCSIWKTDKGIPFLAGSCDHSTLAGRDLTTLFPSS